MNGLKVFVFDSGEQEMIAARTEEEARDIFTEMTGVDDFDEYDISEYPEEGWGDFKIEYPDDDPPCVKTLKEVMAEITEPEYLCSSIY